MTLGQLKVVVVVEDDEATGATTRTSWMLSGAATSMGLARRSIPVILSCRHDDGAIRSVALSRLSGQLGNAKTKRGDLGGLSQV